jgi:peptidoglycan/xylan/chitin deacetylase (PgdA/CDA1 family)
MGATKNAIIVVCDRLGCFQIGHRLARRRYGNRYVRAVNYHGTPTSSVRNLEEQIRFYQQHFVCCGPEELRSLLDGQGWRHPKPGLLLSFDDGLRSNYTVAAPLLEAAGFVGWFFVPTALIDSPEHSDQPAFAAKHHIAVRELAHGDRAFMTWNEVRDLHARGHVIGVHTRHHVRLSASLSPDELEAEIVSAKTDLETQMGQEAHSFCWVGGEDWSYSDGAARAVERAGYRYGFMTNLLPITSQTDPLWLQRTNVEADWSLQAIRFYLSGLMDLAYTRKRRRLSRKLGGATGYSGRTGSPRTDYLGV